MITTFIDMIVIAIIVSMSIGICIILPENTHPSVYYVIGAITVVLIWMGSFIIDARGGD
ncbi:MAG: hypothetical protein SVK08_12765 [Halobacteriota archaeon]|nr:hypothetical protein [Halobacteriota archaeon]